MAPRLILAEISAQSNFVLLHTIFSTCLQADEFLEMFFVLAGLSFGCYFGVRGLLTILVQ